MISRRELEMYMDELAALERERDTLQEMVDLQRDFIQNNCEHTWANGVCTFCGKSNSREILDFTYAGADLSND